jgi:hypothetical protein
MLLLLLATVTPPPLLEAKASALAMIRVLQPASATAGDWTAADRRSERVITDEFGRKLRLRTIDFE